MEGRGQILGAIGAVVAALVASPARAQSVLAPLPGSESPQPPSGELPPLPPGPTPAESQRASPPPKAGADDVATAPPEPQEAPVQETPSRERTWYGWQVLLVDGASAAIFVAGTRISSPGVTAVGALGYLGGGPTVHFAHGNGIKGLASLGFRVGAPLGGALVGGLIGAAFQNNNSNNFIPLWAIFGLLGFSVGIVAAPVLDVSLLAFEPKPAQPSASSTVPTFRIAPVAGLPRDAGGHSVPTFGVVGVF